MKSKVLPSIAMVLALSLRSAAVASDLIVDIKDSPKPLAQLPRGGTCPGADMESPPPYGPGTGPMLSQGMGGLPGPPPPLRIALAAIAP